MNTKKLERVLLKANELGLNNGNLKYRKKELKELIKEAIENGLD